MGAKKVSHHTVVKKVRAYPFDIQVFKNEGTPPLDAKILRVNTIGLQMKCDNYLYKVGEEVKVVFTIPIFLYKVEEIMKVIKTTDRYKDDAAKTKTYITELHFKLLNFKNSKNILEFIRTIRQKD